MLTRSEIATSQNNAALRSMFELKGMERERAVELYFGPKSPTGNLCRFTFLYSIQGFDNLVKLF